MVVVAQERVRFVILVSGIYRRKRWRSGAVIVTYMLLSGQYPGTVVPFGFQGGSTIVQRGVSHSLDRSGGGAMREARSG